jgi:hypothetical protein
VVKKVIYETTTRFRAAAKRHGNGFYHRSTHHRLRWYHADGIPTSLVGHQAFYCDEFISYDVESLISAVTLKYPNINLEFSISYARKLRSKPHREAEVTREQQKRDRDQELINRLQQDWISLGIYGPPKKVRVRQEGQQITNKGT